MCGIQFFCGCWPDLERKEGVKLWKTRKTGKQTTWILDITLTCRNIWFISGSEISALDSAKRHFPDEFMMRLHSMHVHQLFYCHDQ
jgi:hypothetical protein